MGVLRLLLALSVVNAHGGNLLGFQFLMSSFAVQSFYMISGFYMALVLNEKYRPDNSTYLQFIANRFLRIFPGYFVVLLLTILLFLVANWYYGQYFGPARLWSENWAGLDWPARLFLLFSHLALFGQDAYLFLGMDGLGGLQFDPDFRASHSQFHDFKLVPQAWSLSIELCFYLLAPFLVRRSAAWLASMITACIALRFALAYWLGWQDDPWSYRFFPSELALFLCGAGAYRIYRAVRIGKMDMQTMSGWVALGVAAGAALTTSYYPSPVVVWWNIGLVVSVLLVLPFLFSLTKRSKIDGHIGELSYPMYLCHMLVIWSFDLMQVQRGMVWSACVLFATILLSIVLYWHVDRRVDDFRHRRFAAAPSV